MKSKFVKRPITVKIENLLTIDSTKFGKELVETVNGRNVWEWLRVKSDFSHWIKRRILDGQFEEGVDFAVAKNNGVKNQQVTTDVGDAIDYHVSIDMAKHLCMLERNERGKQARQYFIQCEKDAKQKVVDNLFNLVELGNDMGQVDVSIRLNQKLTRRRLMYVMARHLRCGRHWIQRLTNEIYKTLLDNPAATARNFRQHMNLPAISAEYLTRDQMEGHVQICVSGIEQSMLILFSANQNITFGELRSFAIEQAKLYHARLMAMVQRRPSELIFNHEYNIIPILPYRERRMQTV